ncbi:MAG: hypothetical protein [Microviridae sp.]|nr:MAG: hypothetical protein [Microviridae sp.]
MKRTIKTIIYWCTVIPPVIDFAVGTVKGLYSSVKNFKAWLNQYTADSLNKKIGQDLNRIELSDDDNEYLMNKVLTERAIKNNIIDPKDF